MRMHLPVILLLFFCLPLIVSGQEVKGSDISPAKPLPKRQDGGKGEHAGGVRFEWLEPFEGREAQISNGKALIKAVVKAGETIKKEYLSMEINGQSGSKANEVSLFGSDDEQTLTYLAQVPLDALNKNLNELRISATLPNGKRQTSEPLFVTRDGDRVMVVPVTKPGEGASAGGFDIFWVDPDPIMLGDKPLVQKSQEMEVRFQIASPQVLLREHLSIVVNKVLQPLSPSAVLKGVNGRYSLVDMITLNDKVVENIIQLHIQIPNGPKLLSMPLRVNYASDRPNLYVLSIGTKTNLAYTVKDAKDFADLYKLQGGIAGNRLFKSVQTDLLTGAAATAAEIQGTIEELLVKMNTGVIQPSDLVMLFISSHGFIDDRTQSFRIQGDDFDAARSRATSVSYQDDILAVLAELPCKKLIFIDACHSGSGARATSEDIQKEIDKLNAKKEGLTVIVSSMENEESYEDVTWRNGAFTEAILKGLGEGVADKNANGIVTIKELFDYISLEVPEMVGAVKNKPQHPRLLNNELGNVSIFVVGQN